MPTITINVTKQNAVAELKRRGRFPGFAKDLNNSTLYAQAGPATRLSADELYLIAGTGTNGVTRLARSATSATVAEVTKDRSNPFGLTETQQVVREWIFAQTGGNEPTVRYKSGARKGQVRKGRNPGEYRRLMDLAGIPRQVRKNESVSIKTVSRGPKSRITVGDPARTAAFAAEHGIG